jgi:hypothetical protein
VKFVTVFLGMVALDFIWSRYITANAIGTAWAASWWATAITLLSGYVTLAFVNDPILLIPACAGAWVGTFAAKWRPQPVEQTTWGD